jgi:hypothetical protein
MTDISSPSVPASQNSTGEPATPSGPHVASMSITVVQPRGTTGLVRVGSATRSAELCVRDPGDDPCYCGEPGDVSDSTALGVTAAAITTCAIPATSSRPMRARIPGNSWHGWATTVLAPR